MPGIMCSVGSRLYMRKKGKIGPIHPIFVDRSMREKSVVNIPGVIGDCYR